MPSHLHYIIDLLDPDYGISEMQRDFKRHTARQILEGLESAINKPAPQSLPIFETANFLREPAKDLLEHFREAGRIANQKYRVWLPDNEPEAIFTQKFFEQKLEYVHANAVKAKMVSGMTEYPYSSAEFHETGKEGLIPVTTMRFLD